jgi:hypothetical protein
LSSGSKRRRSSKQASLSLSHMIANCSVTPRVKGA